MCYFHGASDAPKAVNAELTEQICSQDNLDAGTFRGFSGRYEVDDRTLTPEVHCAFPLRPKALVPDETT